MKFKGKLIRRFFILDVDNNDQPQTMLNSPAFYQAPDAPHIFMSASQMRDMMNIVAAISDRIGGYKERIQWWAELAGDEGNLVLVENYNDLGD